MRKKQRSSGETWRGIRGVGMLGVSTLAAVFWPAMAAAEPTASDVARDVAGLAARVSDLEFLRTIVLGLLGASILGLPALWWRLGKRISRVADARISSLLESRPGALLTLVEEHDREVKLRRESRIVIVSDGLDLETVLRQHGFFRVVSKPPESDLGAVGEAAAVVFDLQTLSEEKAANLMRRHGLEHALAYTTGRANLPNATFANSPITLFARLCELLKFEAAREQG